jgi:hypothetical protein
MHSSALSVAPVFTGPSLSFQGSVGSHGRAHAIARRGVSEVSMKPRNLRNILGTTFGAVKETTEQGRNYLNRVVSHGHGREPGTSR